MTFFGHADIFPEYYISIPPTQSVTAQGITVVDRSDASKGSAGQTTKALEARGWYFNSVSACANGTWLEGGLP